MQTKGGNGTCLVGGGGEGERGESWELQPRHHLGTSTMWNARVYFGFFGGLECAVGHPFAYVAHFVFLGDVWIRTQRATLASRYATKLATHLPKYPSISLLSTISLFSHPLPYL